MHEKTFSGPTEIRERHLILDVLRGLALAGIALANFPEFGLWTFLSGEEQSMMPTTISPIFITFAACCRKLKPMNRNENPKINSPMLFLLDLEEKISGRPKVSSCFS